jgi:hypothetical protein
MRSVAPCFAGVFVLLTAVVASADVGDYLGKPVASIRLTSEGHDTIDQRLLRIVQTRVGRPLTMVDVRETMVHLFSLGRFEDVLVRADITPGGVSLIYELMPVYPVERIRFIGSLEAPGIDEGRLRRSHAARRDSARARSRGADLQDRRWCSGARRRHPHRRIAGNAGEGPPGSPRPLDRRAVRA